MPKKTRRPVIDLETLRAKVADIIVSKAIPVDPRSSVDARIDALIGDLVASRSHEFEEEAEEALAHIPDPIQASDFHGHIMAEYGDAGYFVGVAAGLELAARTGSRAVPVRKRGGR